jgi:hypothetical protein
MPKRSKKVRSRELRLDLRATLEAVTFEDAVGQLETDLRARWKGKNLSGDAKRQALESGWAKDLLTALMHVRFAIGRGDAEATALQTLKLAVTMKAFEYAFCCGEDQMRGAKASPAGRRGAEMKQSRLIPRNRRMALEFIARSKRPSGRKGTALMEDIGKAQKPKSLGRSASHAAVMQGLHDVVRDLEAENEQLKDFVRQGAKPDK